MRRVRHHLAEALVAVASILVPRGRRREWIREWRGELRAWHGEGRPVVRPALGAFRHGAWHRWHRVATGWRRWRNRTIPELRVALRGVRRRPAFTLAVVATLAVGMAAATAVFSVVDTVLLAPLPYPGGDRFVEVKARYVPLDFGGVGLTPPILEAWNERARSVETIEAFHVSDKDLVGDAAPPAVARAAEVTPGLLPDLLAVEPLLGRLLTEDDIGPGPRSAALVSEELWADRFGRDPGVLDRTVRLDDETLRIVGVLPPVAVLPEVDLWIPVRREATPPDGVRLGSLTGLARRRPGWTVEAARAELTAAAEAAGRDLGEAVDRFRPVVRDYRRSLVGDVRGNLWILMGAVTAVLLIACVNVANLLLSRAAERERETAVRSSLGATRADLARPVLLEGLVLSALGGGAGLGLGLLLVRALTARVPAEIPLADAAGSDVRLVLFGLGLTALTGLLFSLFPALRTGRRGLTRPVPRSGGPGRREGRRGALLVALEVAQASVLLVAALLMVDTLVRLSSADAGFDPDGLMFVHLELPPWSYGPSDEPELRIRFVDRLRAELSALPGVERAAVGSGTPFSGITFVAAMEQEGGPRPGAGSAGVDFADPGMGDRAGFSVLWVDDDYLETLGLPILDGRALRPGDIEGIRAGDGGGDPVALVNETAARAYWPGESVVGRRVRPDGDGPWVTIVGVVGDVTHPGLPTEGTAEMYAPLERPTRIVDALVRFRGDPEALGTRIREAVWSIDPELPIPAVRTAREELAASLAMTRFYTLLLAVFAGLALLLTAVGIYGVMAWSVARRTREMGIRMALGAHRWGVAGKVVAEALAVVAAGLVPGLAAAALGSRVLESLLYGVAPLDPATYAAVALSVPVVAAAAAWGPARRATRADPVAVLRSE